MNATGSVVWRLAVCTVACLVGTILGGTVASALGVALPAIPAATDPGSTALFGLLGCAALAFGMAPLASGLGVGFSVRWAILALLAYVCLGVNTAIESAIFTTFGGTAGFLVMNVFWAGVLSAALAALFRASGAAQTWSARWRDFVGARRAPEWAWRVAAAIAVFPVIYLAFGSLIAPVVLDSYRAGRFGLVLPGYGVIIPVQLVRSTLFLGASLPALVAWRGSRPRLMLALGAAHFVLDGLFGMLQAYWLPTPIRVAHTLEILGDSLTYAAVIVALLARRGDDAERVGSGAAPAGAALRGLASSR